MAPEPASYHEQLLSRGWVKENYNPGKKETVYCKGSERVTVHDVPIRSSMTMVSPKDGLTIARDLCYA